MSAHMIDKLLFLVIFVTIARVLWCFFPYREAREEKISHKEIDPAPQPEAVQQQMDQAPVALEPTDEVPQVLAVRDLCAKPKASLLVRYRAAKHACTGTIIVWAGAKRKRMSDSYYDLGIIEGVQLTDDVVEKFMTIARKQLDELAVTGKRKRRASKEVKMEEAGVTEVAEALAEATSMLAEQGSGVPPVVVEDTPGESIKLRKFPSVYRGIIKEIGMMKRNKNGEEFDTFGVRFETQEGIVDAVFGVNLRDALREARAGVGDEVEILKIGRKTIEKGKGPMNLFKIAKLTSSA